MIVLSVRSNHTQAQLKEYQANKVDGNPTKATKNEKPFVCLVGGCGKRYTRKGDLTKHTKKNHSTEEVREVINYSKTRSSTRPSLRILLLDKFGDEPESKLSVNSVIQRKLNSAIKQVSLPVCVRSSNTASSADCKLT